MSSVAAVILAGGMGLRVGGDRPKQFIEIDNKPVLIYTLEQFCSHKQVDTITIVIPEEYQDHLQNLLLSYNLPKIAHVVIGGQTRQESAWNGLNAKEYEIDDIILIHDAARPFVSHEIISSSIQAAMEYGAASVYVPAVDTVTAGSRGFVKTIPPRDNLYYTQTPQAFKHGIIHNAHVEALKQGELNASDDVVLVLKQNQKVKMVEGSYNNIKITTPEDIKRAEYILSHP